MFEERTTLEFMPGIEKNKRRKEERRKGREKRKKENTRSLQTSWTILEISG